MGEEDDGCIHGARYGQPDAVDVGFEGVRHEGVVQHDQSRTRWLAERRRFAIQRHPFQHGTVSRYGRPVTKDDTKAIDGDHVRIGRAGCARGAVEGFIRRPEQRQRRVEFRRRHPHTVARGRTPMVV